MPQQKFSSTELDRDFEAINAISIQISPHFSSEDADSVLKKCEDVGEMLHKFKKKLSEGSHYFEVIKKKREEVIAHVWTAYHIYYTSAEALFQQEKYAIATCKYQKAKLVLFVVRQIKLQGNYVELLSDKKQEAALDIKIAQCYEKWDKKTLAVRYLKKAYELYGVINFEEAKKAIEMKINELQTEIEQENLPTYKRQRVDAPVTTFFTPTAVRADVSLSTPHASVKDMCDLKIEQLREKKHEITSRKMEEFEKNKALKEKVIKELMLMRDENKKLSNEILKITENLKINWESTFTENELKNKSAIDLQQLKSKILKEKIDLNEYDGSIRVEKNHLLQEIDEEVSHLSNVKQALEVLETLVASAEEQEMIPSMVCH